MQVEHIGNATSIYCLCHPRTKEVRYIGKTIRPLMDRLKQHICQAKLARLPIHRWIVKVINSCGEAPTIKLIETVDKGKNWQARESFWIAYYKGLGHKMLNLTSGGKGLCGLKLSEEHKRKIALAHFKGEEFNCINCKNPFVRKQSEILRGENKFCSRACYQKWQKGRTKNASFSRSAIEKAAALKKARTHCINGHEFSPENTKVNRLGARVCRACERISKAKYRAKLCQ